MNKPPLHDLRVLDFTTLLPGPLATLLLAEAGATVVKIEHPKGGDPARARRSAISGASVEFALVNRGKKSIALDLKSPAENAQARKLALQADVLVEQFRPGVMARLGLGYDALREHNPRLIYCSISGYGQTGPLAQVAAHDLNYIARSGMLGTSTYPDGRPVLPQGQIADIGGGTLPAVINILLALLRQRETGEGCYLDIAMAENTFMWMRRPLAPVLEGGDSPPPGSFSNTGASPRLGTYLAKDGVALAVVAVEEKFWTRFCDLIGLTKSERDDVAEPAAVRTRVSQRLAARTGAEWKTLFEHEDVCVEVAQSVASAFHDAHFQQRGVFDRSLQLSGSQTIPALPVPLAQEFLASDRDGCPALGSTAADDDAVWNR